MLTHFAYPCRDTPFVDAEHADQCALHKMYIHKCSYASESKQYMYVCVYLYTYIYIHIHTCLFICQKAYLQSRTSTKTQNTSEPRCKHVCVHMICVSVCPPACPLPACLPAWSMLYVCMYVCGMSCMARYGLAWHAMCDGIGLYCIILSTYVHISSDKCMYVCLYVCVQVCMYVCMYVCVCVCMCCTARYGMAWHGMFDGMGLYLLSCQVCKPSESQRQ